MGLENSRQKPKNPDEPDQGRRNFLKGLAAVGTTAAVGGVGKLMVDVGKSQMASYNAEVAEREEEERPFTHVGKAVVLNKIEKGGSGSPTAAELVDGAAVGHMLGGLGGAAMMVGNMEAAGQMDVGHEFYLQVKIDGREPVLKDVTSLMYRITKIGDELPVEYVTDHEDTKKIAKIKRLEPLRN